MEYIALAAYIIFVYNIARKAQILYKGIAIK
jgi:hypothetical protein